MAGTFPSLYVKKIVASKTPTFLIAPTIFVCVALGYFTLKEYYIISIAVGSAKNDMICGINKK